jgi:broad specificity phosphatase PhoE
MDDQPSAHRTDLPLTARGEDHAWGLHGRLRGLAFDRVFVSPLRRARQTSMLAGFGDEAVTVADLTEWDYGAYEGLTTAEIRRERPGWSLFRHGCPGGESFASVCVRVDRVIALLRVMPGRILVFGHGQFFGVLAARWVGLPPGKARPPRCMPRRRQGSARGSPHPADGPRRRASSPQSSAAWLLNSPSMA